MNTQEKEGKRKIVLQGKRVLKKKGILFFVFNKDKRIRLVISKIFFG